MISTIVPGLILHCITPCFLDCYYKCKDKIKNKKINTANKRKAKFNNKVEYHKANKNENIPTSNANVKMQIIKEETIM